jgi:hypothetical protein
MKIGKLNNNQISYTYSTRLLLPMLGLKSSDFKKLINVHINDNEDSYLIVIVENTDESTVDIVRCTINDYYIEHYTNEDEICIKFKIPNAYLSDFEKFKIGNYSGFSDDYKKRLTIMYGQQVIPKGIDVSMYDVIHPRLEKRKAISERTGESLSLIKEVMSSPDLDYEIYKSINQLNITTVLTNE